MNPGSSVKRSTRCGSKRDPEAVVKGEREKKEDCRGEGRTGPTKGKARPGGAIGRHVKSILKNELALQNVGSPRRGLF